MLKVPPLQIVPTYRSDTPETSVTIKSTDLNALGTDFEKHKRLSRYYAEISRTGTVRLCRHMSSRNETA